MYIDKIMLVDENFIQIVITNTQIISDLQYIGVMKCDEMWWNVMKCDKMW